MAGDGNKFGFPDERIGFSGKSIPRSVWAIWAIAFAGALAGLIVMVSGTDTDGTARVVGVVTFAIPVGVIVFGVVVGGWWALSAAKQGLRRRQRRRMMRP